MEQVIVGESLTRKFILAPAAALYPCLPGMGVGKLLYPPDDFFEVLAAIEQGGEQRFPITHEMRMGIDKTRIYGFSTCIDHLPGRIFPFDLVVGAYRQYFPVLNGEGLRLIKSAVHGLD